MGLYPTFIKTPAVLAADVHPLVFQLYKATAVFLTGWLFLIPRAIRAARGDLPEGEHVYEFTYWGLVSAVSVVAVVVVVVWRQRSWQCAQVHLVVLCILTTRTIERCFGREESDALNGISPPSSLRATISTAVVVLLLTAGVPTTAIVPTAATSARLFGCRLGRLRSGLCR